MSRPAGRQSKTSDTPCPADIPIWPGLIVAVICFAVFLWFGTDYGDKLRTSSYIHHSLTAKAWLNGRLHLTADDIRRAYYVNWFHRSNRPIAESATTDEMATRYFQIQEDQNRRKGITGARWLALRSRLERAPFHDWVHIRESDRYYAYWPPLPAMIMLPFVAVSGPTVSDMLVANCIGAITALFMFLCVRQLRRFVPSITTSACVLATILYCLGTCNMYQASLGQVWFLTQVSGTLFLIIAIWFGLRCVDDPRWIIAAGVALGLAFLGRLTIVLAGPFFAVMLWIAVRQYSDWMKRYVKYGVGFMAPILIIIAAQFAFNYARFGDWREFGQGLLVDENGNPIFVEDFREYGRFHPHYLATNLKHYFFNFKTRQYPMKSKEGLTFDPYGNSLFMTTPAMIFIFMAWRLKRRDLLVATLAGLIPGTVALMFFHGTGFYQFGQRYLLDTMPFFLMMAVYGIYAPFRDRRTSQIIGIIAAVLIVASVAMNFWGTYRFNIEQV